MSEFQDKVRALLMEYSTVVKGSLGEDRYSGHNNIDKALSDVDALFKSQLQAYKASVERELLEELRGYGERGGHDVYCRTIGEEVLNRLQGTTHEGEK